MTMSSLPMSLDTSTWKQLGMPAISLTATVATADTSILDPDASSSFVSPGSSLSKPNFMASSREMIEALDPESAKALIFKP